MLVIRALFPEIEFFMCRTWAINHDARHGAVRPSRSDKFRPLRIKPLRLALLRPKDENSSGQTERKTVERQCKAADLVGIVDLTVSIKLPPTRGHGKMCEVGEMRGGEERLEVLVIKPEVQMREVTQKRGAMASVQDTRPMWSWVCRCR